MKNLFLIFVLLPLFSFSQTLIKDVSRMSYLDSEKNIHKTTEVLTKMSIFVSNEYLYIKDDLETLKYKIVGIYLSDIKGKEITVYEVLVKGEKHIAYVDSVKSSKFLYLKSIEDSDVTFFYEKRG